MIPQIRTLIDRVCNVAERFWLLHNRCILYGDSCCSLRNIDIPGSFCKHKTPQCSGVSNTSTGIEAAYLSKKLRSRIRGRPHYHSSKKEEYAHIKFDLDADFSSLFNWNTKQLFVYITATWPSTSSSSSTPPSQAIIWDIIINSDSQSHPFTPFDLFNSFTTSSGSTKKAGRPLSSKGGRAAKPGIIQIKNSKPKYQITDISGKLSSRENVTLEVGWNVQPWVGALTWTFGEGRRLGRWNGIRGGNIEAFNLPAIKGKSTSQQTSMGSQEKPKAAGASGVV